MVALGKVFLADMPKGVKYAFIATVLMWAAYGFKQIEPYIYPVVGEFSIEQVENISDGSRIAGHMVKSRDCEFLELSAYTRDRFINIAFTETASPVTRVQGQQEWGWWLVTPRVKHITIYARHSCLTGTVITKLFDGEI